MFTLLVAASALAQTAAMFRGGPAHTGVYLGAGVPKIPGLAWRFQTGGRVYSSPAIADGTVYIGSTDRKLYAIDLQTGRQRWSFLTKGQVDSSPAVSGGTVYFGSYDAFYALDAATGKQKWKFPLDGERRFEARGIHGLTPSSQTIPDGWDLFLSSPAVAGGLVYFGSGDGNLYALDAASGRLRWKFATGDVVHSSPAVSGGTVYFGSWDSYFYALDARTGRRRWRFKTGEDRERSNQVGIQSSPAVAGNTVYFGCRDAHLYALDAETGREKWNFFNNYSWVVASPAVFRDTVYFGTSDSTSFQALDARTGQLRFRLPTGTYVFSSPAIAAGMAFFGSFDGKLRAVNLSTGKYAWEFQTEAGRVNGPALLLPSGGLNLKAFPTSDLYEDMQRVLDKLMSMGSILSSPVVVGSTICFGSADGGVYALR